MTITIPYRGEDFCLIHGREHMRSLMGNPIPFCDRCENGRCDKCDAPTTNPENDYGEFICDGCEQNAAEAAYERLCSDFYDGGNTSFKTLQQQQIEAKRLK